MLQMPTVDKALFNGSSNINGSKLVLLEISNYGDSVTRFLHDLKWNNKAIGAVALELSPDNHRVNNGKQHFPGQRTARSQGSPGENQQPVGDGGSRHTAQHPSAIRRRFLVR